MSEGWQVLCFAVALACFLVAAVLFVPQKSWPQMLVALGLGAWVLVALWNANALYD